MLYFEVAPGGMKDGERPGTPSSLTAIKTDVGQHHRPAAGGHGGPAAATVIQFAGTPCGGPLGGGTES